MDIDEQIASELKGVLFTDLLDEYQNLRYFLLRQAGYTIDLDKDKARRMVHVKAEINNRIEKG